jgi:AraC family transcriptional regulator, positive regulator of tynA and feaB
MLVVQTRGSSFFEQNGSGTVLCPGDWSFYDTAKPFSVKVARASEHLVLMHRRDIASAEMLETLALRRFGRYGAAKLVFDLAVSAFSECAHMSARTAEATADSIARLASLALSETPRERNVASRLDLITAYISEHLSDPELDVASIARALDCSPRQIHRVFGEDSDVTVTDYIWKARLDQCVASLRAPESVNLTITEIAFQYGFTSSAHFSRTFRAAFGVAPREYRKGERMIERLAA